MRPLDTNMLNMCLSRAQNIMYFSQVSLTTALTIYTAAHAYVDFIPKPLSLRSEVDRHRYHRLSCCGSQEGSSSKIILETKAARHNLHHGWHLAVSEPVRGSSRLDFLRKIAVVSSSAASIACAASTVTAKPVKALDAGGEGTRDVDVLTQRLYCDVEVESIQASLEKTRGTAVVYSSRRGEACFEHSAIFSVSFFSLVGSP